MWLADSLRKQLEEEMATISGFGLDPARSSRALWVRRIENGWSEVRPDETGIEYHRNVFGEQLMRSGVWAAVFRVCAAKDDKPGGIFVGIAPDGANPSVPLGDRGAGTQSPVEVHDGVVSCAHSRMTAMFHALIHVIQVSAGVRRWPT